MQRNRETRSGLKLGPSSGSCDCSSLSGPDEHSVKVGATLIGNALNSIKEAGNNLSARMTCYNANTDKSSASEFNSKVMAQTKGSKYEYNVDKSLITYPVTLDVQARNNSLITDMGTWTMEKKYTKAENYEHQEIPR